MRSYSLNGINYLVKFFRQLYLQQRRSELIRFLVQGGSQQVIEGIREESWLVHQGGQIIKMKLFYVLQWFLELLVFVHCVQFPCLFVLLEYLRLLWIKDWIFLVNWNQVKWYHISVLFCKHPTISHQFLAHKRLHLLDLLHNAFQMPLILIPIDILHYPKLPWFPRISQV